ncbi:MAG TPA: ribonuclease H-like domain-containing protein [Agriterribacter sp.]|nr:ribonuclease H-like domain-containing protein [Chitinophagaceae bacterium]HRP31176.1 ribonuclease H-like domain-containing protein [Agriterribacter sp.]
MIHQVNLTNLLVLDIETVPGVPDFQQLPEKWKILWQDKISKTMPENILPEDSYLNKAGILAEFGKIVCISTGFFYNEKGGNLCFKLKSFSGDDEAALLTAFVEMLNTFREKRGHFAMAGHNIKEFDIPYICRRMLMLNLPLPESLQLSGRKPWETNLIDTMELWKFGDYKNYVSLNLLASVLGIDTPKDDIDGSMVKDVYYKERNLPRIVTYCQKDVVTVANVILRFRNLPYLAKENINIVE